jgi:hypothetical protein
MRSHRPLLEIDMRHGFYADGACPGLRLAPAWSTRALIERAGGLVRATARGVELWLDERGAADWRDGDPDDALVWLVRCDDADLASRTADLGRPRQELAYFDAGNALLDAPTGYLRLHERHCAAAPDVRSAAAACAGAALDRAELHGDAVALLRIPVRAAAFDEVEGVRYLIRFAPRETVWKYCFVGDWPEPALQVVDLAQQVSFEPVPAHRLADGRTALAFRSSRPIALQELPREHFQLSSRGGDDRNEGRARPGKVIVKRLPAAAPRHFSREVIDGAPALVSEIFVHR